MKKLMLSVLAIAALSSGAVLYAKNADARMPPVGRDRDGRSRNEPVNRSPR